MNHDSIPKYLREGLPKQSVETLEEIAELVDELIDHKQTMRDRADDERRQTSRKHKEEMKEKGIATDPDGYDDVPAGAYVTVKTIDGRDYYYWQWREDNTTWESKYIAPVTPKDS